MKKLALLFIAATVLSGCAKTNMNTYVDPAYQTTSYQRVVIDGRGLSVSYKSLLEEKICTELTDKGIGCSPRDILLPPTRSYSSEETKKIYLSNGYEGALVVWLGKDDLKTGYGGSITSFNGFGMTTTPIVHSSRSVDYQARLYDIKTADVAAFSRANTSAQGTANTTLSVFAESFASELVKQLIEKGLVTPDPNFKVKKKSLCANNGYKC